MKNNHQLSLFTEEDLKQPIVTQKDAFLHFMSRMDIDMLEYVLDDENTYSECTKAVFLEKLNETVTDFKKKGNDNLIYNIGYCAASNCNLGCQGYMFKANKTKNTFSLIIEEKNQKIKDVFECTRFITVKKEKNYTYFTKINIYEEDKVSFQTEVAALIYFQKIDKALEELKTILKSPLDLKMTNYWVDNIKDLIYEIDKEERFIKKYYVITEIYKAIQYINNAIPLSSKIKKLLKESNARSLDLNDIGALGKWCEKNKVDNINDLCNLCQITTYNRKKNLYVVKLSNNIELEIDSKTMKPIHQYYKIIYSIIAPEDPF
jgi:hypothetical protein